MRYKMLVVGNTRAITDAVAKTLGKKNQIILSSFVVEELEIILEQEDPDVVVLCLKTATMEQIAEIVKKNDTLELLKKEIVIIGDEKERLMFQVTAVRYQPLEWSFERGLLGLQEKIDEAMRMNPRYEELYHKRILIIDDDRRTTAVLQEMISDEYDVLVCENGIEAINILSKRRVDGVIISYDLGSMPGRQVYQKIKGMKGYESLPIFFTTMNRSKDVIMDCVSLKPQGLLIKPVQKQDILDSLHKIYDEI